MPGWTITGDDWCNSANVPQDPAIYNQFVNAIKERQDAAGITPTYNPALVSDNANMQDTAKWVLLQNAVEELVPYFVDTGEATAGTFDGYAGYTILMYTLANWRADIGLLGAGFRRVPGADWPADWTSHADAAYTHGVVALDDDIIGPWVMRDLQEGLDLLIWTKRETQASGTNCYWSADGAVNHQNSITYQTQVSWAAAKGGAEADFGSGTGTNDYVGPEATYRGAWDAMPPGSETWEAAIVRVRAKLKAAALPVTCNGTNRTRDLEYYCYTNCAQSGGWTWTYDANGDDVLNAQHSLFGTDAGHTSATAASAFLGDHTTCPNGPATDPKTVGAGLGAPLVNDGYFPGTEDRWEDFPYYDAWKGGTILLKWDVVNGLEYY